MSTLILGNGFVTKSLAKYFPQAIIAGNKDKDPINFDFFSQSTWCKLPSQADLCIITFKLTDLEQTKLFFTQVLSHYTKVIALSSTRTYKATKPNQIINEKCLRDKSQARVPCENFLLTQKAMITCLPLIYGYKRSIERWLKQNHIKNGKKLINLIYVNDLASCLYKLSEKFKPSEIINLSNGKKHCWQELANNYNVILPKLPIDSTSKIICNKKLLTLIEHNFKNQY